MTATATPLPGMPEPPVSAARRRAEDYETWVEEEPVHRLISDSAYRERTKRRIRANSTICKADGCWTWQLAVDRDGYGVIQAPSRDSAHRAAYLSFVGVIPQGHVLDHVCHSRDVTCPGGTACIHRRCVNPAHLEAVTAAVNTLRGLSFSAKNARKSHCVRGHKFTEANTYQRIDGRACRACMGIATANHRAKKKGANR